MEENSDKNDVGIVKVRTIGKGVSPKSFMPILGFLATMGPVMMVGNPAMAQSLDATRRATSLNMSSPHLQGPLKNIQDMTGLSNIVIRIADETVKELMDAAPRSRQEQCVVLQSVHPQMRGPGAFDGWRSLAGNCDDLRRRHANSANATVLTRYQAVAHLSIVLDDHLRMRSAEAQRFTEPRTQNNSVLVRR